jgi:hypothetical protein
MEKYFNAAARKNRGKTTLIDKKSLSMYLHEVDVPLCIDTMNATYLLVRRFRHSPRFERRAECTVNSTDERMM